MAPTSGALGLHWVFVIPATARSPRTVHSNVLPPHTTSSLVAGPVGHGPVSSGISRRKGAKLPGDRTRSKITERQAGGWITVRKEMPPSQSRLRLRLQAQGGGSGWISAAPVRTYRPWAAATSQSGTAAQPVIWRLSLEDSNRVPCRPDPHKVRLCLRHI